MYFERFGRPYAPLMGLLFLMITDVELGQELLHVILILDGHDVGFKILGDI